MYGMKPKKKKTSGYNKGGSMPMVMKEGKKVPAYAADGVGKMNMGGMAKKKPAAKKMSGYNMGGYNMGGMGNSQGMMNQSSPMMNKKPMGMNNKAMAKPGVMTYNMGGMVKSQVDNLKKKNA